MNILQPGGLETFLLSSGSISMVGKPLASGQNKYFTTELLGSQYFGARQGQSEAIPPTRPKCNRVTSFSGAWSRHVACHHCWVGWIPFSQPPLPKPVSTLLLPPLVNATRMMKLSLLLVGPLFFLMQLATSHSICSGLSQFNAM